MLVRKCAKPDKNEFTKIAMATGMGFLVMGFIGFFVKLMFIPINNIIVRARPPPGPVRPPRTLGAL